MPMRVRKKRTVTEGTLHQQLICDIQGPRTVQVITEFIQLQNRLQGKQLDGNQDKFIWRWTADGRYSSQSAYWMMHLGKTQLQGASQIWEFWAPLRVKIFPWLVSLSRIWTADHRRRHNLEAWILVGYVIKMSKNNYFSQNISFNLF